MNLHYLYTLVVAFLIYSYLGWAFECVLCSASEHRFINRGFLNGPYCPIYGAGAIAATLLLSDVDNILALCVTSSIVCCTIEYFTSWMMERIFHARWWDYENRHFNLNGRICLAGAVLFGLACTAVVKLANPLIFQATGTLSDTALMWMALAIVAVLAFDILVTNLGLSAFRNKVDKLCDQMTKRAGEMYSEMMQIEHPVIQGISAAQAQVIALSEEYGKPLSDKIPYDISATLAELASHLTNQERRVMDAFPKLRASARPDAIQELRKKLREAMIKRIEIK